jgi:citrate lyase subunit beta/citryl-CoA lyase
MRGPALLFCPGDRPERFAKAGAMADSAIIDLEDAVAPKEKEFARSSLVSCDLDPAATIVRVNPSQTDDFELDLAALKATQFTTVMLAKTECRADLEKLAGYRVIALCENALGIQNAAEIAEAENVIGLMWGAEDLVSSLGGKSSRNRDGRYRDFARYARSRILIAASARDKFAVDAVYLDINDHDGLTLEAGDASASGFIASACIHPSQVDVIRRAYAPSDDEVSWAQEVLDAARTERGAFRFEGKMIDEPVLRQARRVIDYRATQ